MPVFILWAIPAVIILGGGAYWVVHMHWAQKGPRQAGLFSSASLQRDNMDNDDTLARVVGLALGGVCLLCFTLSALALP